MIPRTVRTQSSSVRKLELGQGFNCRLHFRTLICSWYWHTKVQLVTTCLQILQLLNLLYNSSLPWLVDYTAGFVCVSLCPVKLLFKHPQSSFKVERKKKAPFKALGTRVSFFIENMPHNSLREKARDTTADTTEDGIMPSIFSSTGGKSNCTLLISPHCFCPLGFSALMPTETNHTHILHINERLKHALVMTALDRNLAYVLTCKWMCGEKSYPAT